MQNNSHIRGWDKFKKRLQDEGYWQEQPTVPVTRISTAPQRSFIPRLYFAAAPVIIAIVGSFLFLTHQRTPILIPPAVAA